MDLRNSCYFTISHLSLQIKNFRWEYQLRAYCRSISAIASKAHAQEIKIFVWNLYKQRKSCHDTRQVYNFNDFLYFSILVLPFRMRPIRIHKLQIAFSSRNLPNITFQYFLRTMFYTQLLLRLLAVKKGSEIPFQDSYAVEEARYDGANNFINMTIR